MALTPEYVDAVSTRNLLRVRIMLKDSLLVDKKFYLFEEMRTYAEKNGLNIWMEKTEDIEIVDKAEWNIDLMNLELTRLINDFTKERLEYCQRMIEKVYGITPYSSQQTYTSSPQGQIKGNKADYNNILKSISTINKILRANQSPQGDRTWKYEDIKKIQSAARKIDKACESIGTRRR